MKPSTRSRSHAAAFAGGLTLLQAAPWLILLVSGVSLLAVANESIAYRYFHSFRLVEGEVGTIWEAQGQTLGLLHIAFQHVLNALGVESLRERINLFSYGTLAANSLVFAWVIYRLARDATIDRVALATVASVAIFGIYGCFWGMASARLPDYYTIEVTLTIACLSLYLKERSARFPRENTSWVLALGALAGAMIGIKITLMPAAALPLIPLVLHHWNSPRRLVAIAILWVVAAAGTFAAILYTYYQFDHRHLIRAFAAWSSFVAAPGAEPGFVQSLLNPFKPAANPWVDHRFVWIVGSLWLASALMFGRSGFHKPGNLRIQNALLGLAMLVASLLHVVTIVRRPAETTLFESALFLTSAGAILVLGAAAGCPRPNRLQIGWTALLMVWCGVSAARHFPRPATIAAAGAASRQAWEIHEWINATGRPSIILLPDNNFTSGSVEEALLKGFSDVPTWTITSGYDLLQRIAPGRKFVQSLDSPPPDQVLMWTDIPGRRALAETDAVLSGLLARSGGAPARSWEIRRGPAWVRNVHVMLTGAAEDLSGRPVLGGSDAWQRATAVNPIEGFTVSPADAQPRIERIDENGRSFIRLVATQATDYLALTALLPPLPDETGPLRVIAVARPNRSREVVTQIYDVIDATGTAATTATRIASFSGVWTTHQVETAGVRVPHPSDNFSVGIVNVQPGDTLDVELIELRGPPSP